MPTASGLVLLDELTPEVLSEVLPGGSDLQFDFTLTKNGGSTFNITTGTITSTIRPLGESTAVLADAALSIVSGSAGTCRLLVADTESILFRLPPVTKPLATVWHVLDVKAVVSGAVSHHGPLLFRVRRGLT